MTSVTTNEEWRKKFIDYYTTNAPTKLSMVTDEFMTKWEGKYDQLWAGVTKKYGEPGHPIIPKPTKPRRRGPPSSSRSSRGSGPKKSVTECHDEFVELITKNIPSVTGERPTSSLVNAKQTQGINGLETATFTVCSRIRPVLDHEKELKGDCFPVIFPGAKGGHEKLHTEAALLLTPKMNFRGEPEVTPHNFTLDYVFHTESEDEIYTTVCQPLVARAMEGRTGVIFAYGQTGSGKTFTMNHLMDRVAKELGKTISSQSVNFSYLEILGNTLTDTLKSESKESKEGKGETDVQVKMGEVESGAVELRNLSIHSVSSTENLLELIELAKTKRCVEATEMNDASSRSHGVAMFEVDSITPNGTKGKLYVIDLAGSESGKDQKKHDRARISETKKINVSLNALKECIQARTLASTPGSAVNTHVPFRRSRLTLLLKDIFDINCPRLTATVVIATVNPFGKDAGQTKTTLDYAAPLREAVGMFGRNRKKQAKQRTKQTESKTNAGATAAAAATATAATATPIVFEIDPNDPVLWNTVQLSAWLTNDLQVATEVATTLNNVTGLQLCTMSEPVLHTTVGDSAVADQINVALWKLIVTAKLVKRRSDGTILSDEAEAAEAAEKKAEDEARMEAQAARAKAAIQADKERRATLEQEAGMEEYQKVDVPYE